MSIQTPDTLRASASPREKLPTLHLHVCTKYFEQIKRGEKPEEYRLHCAYWIKRLVEMPSGKKRNFAGIVVHNAYKPGAENRLSFPWNGWRLKGITHPHFGEDEVNVFAIQLSRGGAQTRSGT